MSNSEGFELIVNRCRETIVSTLKDAQAVHGWLMFSEDETAVNQIAIIALGLILNNMPPGVAIAYAVKTYHEVLEES